MTIPNAVYENGKVAVVYYQPIPKYIKVGQTEVVFDCQYGVSLAWVSEDDVSPLTSYFGGCCGGKRHVVSLATSTQVSHWKDGKGGRA